MNEGLASQTIKAIDAYTINEIGIPSMVLMERAALAIADELLDHTSISAASYAVVCGTGNNGGDGLAIGRMLHQAGKTVKIYLVGNVDKASDECRKQLRIAKNLGLTIDFLEEGAESFSEDVVLDALFGIGLDRDVEEPHKTAIDKINRSHGYVVAVDVPSGISADTGKAMGTAVIADSTLTIGFMKTGFNVKEAQAFIGKLKVMAIGYPERSLLKGLIKEELTND
ncbi:yjeF N-terminal region [Alkalibacterium subtropicum]|uniref:NAD(P)H-hydrate epimerase n=1 Tax=Alkalibacterium subtropicum TaxID=753702 RepID=A0A1I1LHT6_9LACT|nr:NAD(P)H-hydrate epimerase [Alkalibacterium subtropicum]SFC72757.1 yjeF N-terminal region [Alkalibacterium subtropicum]